MCMLHATTSSRIHPVTAIVIVVQPTTRVVQGPGTWFSWPFVCMGYAIVPTIDSYEEKPRDRYAPQTPPDPWALSSGSVIGPPRHDGAISVGRRPVYPLRCYLSETVQLQNGTTHPL